MSDQKLLDSDTGSQAPKIRKDKDSIVLLNERYNTPNTSLLLFHFEPTLYPSSMRRLKGCSIQHHSVEDKDVYLFDDFFLMQECTDLRTYSRNAAFSRMSYASQSSREQGEEPARSMNNKEKWEFFAKPPQVIQETYKLLSTLAEQMDADISTLPWDLCDQNICASAVATNRLESVSKESMDMGKHEDFNTQTGIPFGIPVLYPSDKTMYPGNFENGSSGYPWLVSLMVYATEENFLAPDYGIGTIFCKKNGEVAVKADSRNARFVLFEGEILHSIEESRIPAGVKSWRISYVFKLIINPRKAGQSMKEIFKTRVFYKLFK